jgi:hypothetical protein
MTRFPGRARDAVESPDGHPLQQPKPGAVIFFIWTGLIPYLVLLIAAWSLDKSQSNLVTLMAVVYAASVFTFVGAVRWGAELMRNPADPSLLNLIIAALPSVISPGLVLLAIASGESSGVLMALLVLGIVQLVWDIPAMRSGALARWLIGVRPLLTLLASLCLFGVLLRAYIG